MHGGPHLTRRVHVAAARWPDTANEWTWAGPPTALRRPRPPSPQAEPFSLRSKRPAQTTTSWATSAQINAYLERSQIRPLLRAITETKNIRSVPSRCARAAVLTRARFRPGRATSQGL